MYVRYFIIVLISSAFISECIAGQYCEGFSQDDEKFMVEGPWNIGQPIHEIITLYTVSQVLNQLNKLESAHPDNFINNITLDMLPDFNSKNTHNIEIRSLDIKTHQLLRGVIWPDDPEGLFFDNTSDACDFSSGINWLQRFDAKNTSDLSNYTARSHFGNLQFLHSMANSSDKTNIDTKNKVLSWADFLVSVITLKYDNDVKLSSIRFASDLFPSSVYIGDLFGVDDEESDFAIKIRQRAAGVLLHLIQDSYSKGHVNRSFDYKIIEFYNYNDASHDRDAHKEFDSWSEGENLNKILEGNKEMSMAVRSGVDVLLMIIAKKRKDEIMGYLENKVFNL